MDNLGADPNYGYDNASDGFVDLERRGIEYELQEKDDIADEDLSEGELKSRNWLRNHRDATVRVQNGRRGPETSFNQSNAGVTVQGTESKLARQGTGGATPGTADPAPIDGNVPSPLSGRETGVVRRDITERKKQFLREKVGVNVIGREGQVSKELLANTELL